MQKEFKIIFIFLFVVLVAQPIWALNVYWGIHPDKERLVFQFKNIINYKYKVIINLKKRSVILKIPYTLLSKENIKKNIYNIQDTKLLSSVIFYKNKNYFLIKTKSKKFKVKYFYLKDENKIVIDFYYINNKLAEKNNKKNIKQNLFKNTTIKNNNDNNTISKKKILEKNISVSNSNNTNVKINSNSTANNSTKTFSINNSTSKLNNDNNTVNKNNKRIKLIWDIKGKIDKKATIYNPNTNFSYIEEIEYKKNIKEKKNKNIPIKYEIKKKIVPKLLIEHPVLYNKNATKNPPSNKLTTQELRSGSKKTLPTPKPSSLQNSTNTNLSSNEEQNATTKVDYEQKLFQIKLQINNGEYDSARQALEELYNDVNLPMKIREDVIFILVDVYMQVYKDKLKENYYKITNLIKEGLYLFPNSPYKAEALLKLCYLNLIVDNLEEAKGYFNLLKSEYPKSSYVAQAYYYFGNYYYKNKNYINAMENYKTVVENYQTSSVVRDAAIKLTRVLYKLQMYKKAWIVMKYLEQRWPLYYQKAPDILKLNGFVAMFNKKYDLALSYYWKYYNIVPDIQKKDADIILTRIGDLYLKKGLKQYAKRMYIYVAKKYPDKEGGLIAKMRLAEEGIYDEPTIKEMFSVFNRPYNLRPVQIYTEIVERHPDSPLAPLAQLKLSMWYLWKNNYSSALKSVKRFFEKFPQSPLKERALKIGRIALSSLIKKAVKNGMYSYVLSLWNDYSFLRKDLTKIDPETVIGVAISMWRTGKPAMGLNLARPYLSKKKLDKTGVAALELVLNIYLQSESWRDIVELGDRFLKNKYLSPDVRSQLKYAYALAKVNLGMGKQAIPYLKDLALDPHITEKQRGYVFYFLAKEEMNLDNYQQVYLYAQEALSILLRQKDSFAKIADCFNMLIDVTKNSGRILEAIEWAERFKQYIPKDYPNWPQFEYNLAMLYHDAGYLDKWKEILTSLRDKYPDTFYGQMASSDLENLRLKREAEKLLQ